MTMADAPAPAPRLAFGKTFGAGFVTVFGQLWTFIKASLLPFVLSLLIGLLGFLLTFGATLGSGISVVESGGDSVVAGTGEQVAFALVEVAMQILGMLPFVILGIACSRLALIGRQAGVLPRPLLGRRTLVYLGYSLLFLLILAVPAIVIFVYSFSDVLPFFAVGSVPAGMEDPEAVLWWVLRFIVIYFVFMYFVTRLSLVFPAVAVDQKLGLGGSWRLTRGAAGFKLYAVFILLTLALLIGLALLMFLVSSIFSFAVLAPNILAQDPAAIDVTTLLLAQTPTLIIGLVFQYLGSAIMIVALASAYAQLTGWGGPRAELLERFE